MSITLKGRYEIDTSDFIDQGNYSIVFHCKDLENQQLKLAAKMIALPNMDMSKSQQEYQILNSLQEFLNPHIVKCYEICQYEDKIIIIMELCEMGNLSKKINQMKKDNQLLTAAQILDFIYQFIDGAYLLHKKNIFHRDIKPQNILLTLDSKQNILFKICDFGSARIVQHMRQEDNFTKYSTRKYESPEIYYQQLFSPQSDMFSFGIVLYELCFLTLPYNYDNKEKDNFFQQLKYKKFQINMSIIKGTEQEINLIKLILEQTIVYNQQDRIDWKDLQDIITDFQQASQNIYEEQNFSNYCYIIAKQHINLLINKSILVKTLMVKFQDCFQLKLLDISYQIFQLTFTTLACCIYILNLSINSFRQHNYNNLSSNLKTIITQERFDQLSDIYNQNFQQDNDNNQNFDEFDINRHHYAFGMAQLQIDWINDVNRTYQNQFMKLHDHLIRFIQTFGIDQNYEDYICNWNHLFETQIQPKIPQNNQKRDLIIFLAIQRSFSVSEVFYPQKNCNQILNQLQYPKMQFNEAEAQQFLKYSLE